MAGSLRLRGLLVTLPLVAFVIVAMTAAPSWADTFEWTDPNSGDFDVTGNWTNTTGADLAPPNAGDIAQFNELGTYTVTFNANAASDVLQFETGVVTFTSSGGPHTYDLTTGNADAIISGGQVILSGTNLDIGDDFNVVNSLMMVEAGSDVSVADRTNIATSAGDAELSFDASSFDFGGLVRFGLSGFDATLTLQNSSTGNIGGDLDFVRSGTLGTGGFLSVLSGSTLTTNGRVLVGDILTGGSPDYNAFLTVDDPNSTFTMNGANLLRVGDSALDNVNAELRVSNNGTFITGTDSIIVQRTGLLAIESGGSFTARGTLAVTQGATLSIDGGSLDAEVGLDASGGTLTFDDGTLTVTGGVFAPNAGGPTDDYVIDGPTLTEMPHLTIGAGATANIGEDISVGNDNRGELTITGGGTVSNRIGGIGGFSGSIGTATVEGAGSTWTNSSTLAVGTFGNGTLNILGGGTVSNATSTIANGSNSTSTATVDGVGSTWTNSSLLRVGRSGDGTLNILGGGTVSNTLGQVGSNIGSTGTVTVDGAGSTWTNSNGLRVGGNSASAGGTGTLNVQNSGLVEVLFGGLKLWGPGTVNLDGGSIITDTFDNSDGGTFNFITGSLTINSGIEIGTGTVFPQTVSLNSDQVLITPLTTTIAPFRTLTLDGGTLQTGFLNINGTLQFNNGMLGFTGAGGLTVGAAGPLGSFLSVAASQAINVTNTATVDAGASLVIESGGAFDAGTLANGGSVVLAGPAAALGGTTLSNNSGGIVRGEGTISAVLNNNAGGEIRAEASKTLLFTAAPGASAGQISLQGGTVQFAQALTNGATGDIVGRGTLIVGGAGLTNEGDLALSNGQTDIFGDVANQTTGRVIISGESDVTFWDDVSDSGTLFHVHTGSSVTFFGTAGFGIDGGGEVYLEADVTPGSSPGSETFGGNVHFGVLSTLEIEIGGLSQGIEYDALDIAGTASLDGTLDVLLLGGFSPLAGDTFEILSAAGGLSGTFATENLPALTGQLFWNVNYDTLSDLVVLEVVSPFTADFDLDGDVDSDDLAQWEGDFGGAGSDADGDGDSDGADFLAWQQQLGSGVGAVSSPTTAVPEPSSATLFSLMVVSSFVRQLRRR